MSLLTMSDVAKAAIAKIDRGWTNVAPAINAKGKPCHAWSEEAVAWSLLGSLSVATCVREDKLVIQVIGRMKVFLPKGVLLSEVDTGPDAARAWLAKAV